MRGAVIAALALPLAGQALDEAFLRTAEPREIMVRATERARALQPLDSRMLAEYGQSYLAAGDRSKALECFERAALADPRDSETHRLIAHAWFQQGAKAEGLEALKPLRASNLKFMDGYLRAALDLLSFVGPQEADAVMETAFLKEPKDWKTFLEFGNACIPSHPQMAAKWLMRSLRDDAQSAHLNAAMDLMAAGHATQAQEIMDVFLKKEPKDWQASYRMAHMASVHGAPALAKHYLERAQSQFSLPRAEGSTNVQGLVNIGTLRLASGDRAGAEEAFRLASLRLSRDSELHAQIAQAWFLHGFRAEGLKALEPLNAPNLKDGGGALAGALAYVSQRLGPEAERLMDRHLALQPREWEDRLRFGEAALAAGLPEVAARWMAKPGLKKEAKENLGLAAIRLLDAGQPKAAEQVMETAYGLDPGDWPNCCEFARAAIRNGDRALAAKYYQRAIERNPTSERMWNEIALAFAQRGIGIRNSFHPQ